MELIFKGVNGNYDIFMDCIQAIIGSNNRDSFIDLGSNHATVTGLLTDFKERKYVDVIDRVLDYPNEQQYFEQCDILLTPLSKHYSISFALDVPEHLNFEEGKLMYRIMDIISDKQIMFTPDTPWMMTDESDLNPESHRSLWTPKILEDLYPKKYAFISFPNYHPALNIGAFFYWSCDNIEQDFNRVKSELKEKTWTK